MSWNLLARLGKIQAKQIPAKRLVPIANVGGDEVEIEAQKAELIRKGEASKYDNFVTCVTIYEEDPLRLRRKTQGQNTRPLNGSGLASGSDAAEVPSEVIIPTLMEGSRPPSHSGLNYL